MFDQSSSNVLDDAMVLEFIELLRQVFCFLESRPFCVKKEERIKNFSHLYFS